MDYIGNQCPVCHQYFHVGDDVVVCPDCGTPHHRECYEQTGHCCNEHLHAEGYDYNESGDSDKADVKICPSCGSVNQPHQFFCTKCGSPLCANDNQQSAANQQTNQTQGFPFGMGGFGNGTQDDSSPNAVPFYMDPLGGVPADEDLGDGVTAGEAAKYVKQNTPYYIRIFSNIKNLNSGRFNFFAAIFPGGYMLYRKMYKAGAFFAGVQLGMLLLKLYIIIAYSSLLQQLYDVVNNSMTASNAITDVMQFIQKLPPLDAITLYLYSTFDMVNIAIMIVVGICFNRMYFKHCKKQIVKIKENAKDGENPDTLLQTKGGVNMPLTISYFATYFIVNMILYFI